MWCRDFMSRRGLIILIFALLFGCGGGSGDSGNTVVAPLPNAMSVTVDSGPTGNEVNRLFASVTVCVPQTSNCQTIDHVVVDTGSSGLRLLASVLSPTLNLPKQSTTAGTPLLNCVQFVDSSFAWGPLVRADVSFGGKVASGLSVQVIADPAISAPSSLCSSGLDQSTPQALGAKGILGVGMLAEDCGPGCATIANNGYYFQCTGSDCKVAVPTTVPVAQQIKNPIAMLATDNNGIVIDLPSANLDGAVRLEGTLYFGISSKANNQPNATQVIVTDALGNFSTRFSGRTYSQSYVDTGSNGNYFDTPLIPLCTDPNAKDFYCSTAMQPWSATLIARSGKSASNGFSVGNALTMFSSPLNSVMPALAGSALDAKVFAWGLPFFYGKRVTIGIEGQSSPLGTGPLFAY
jgi:hypothetical protein